MKKAGCNIWDSKFDFHLNNFRETYLGKEQCNGKNTNSELCFAR